VAALALALGLVQGGVGVPDEFGPVRAGPLQDHNPDARVLLDLGPREGERLRDTCTSRTRTFLPRSTGLSHQVESAWLLRMPNPRATLELSSLGALKPSTSRS